MKKLSQQVLPKNNFIDEEHKSNKHIFIAKNF